MRTPTKITIETTDIALYQSAVSEFQSQHRHGAEAMYLFGRQYLVAATDFNYCSQSGGIAAKIELIERPDGGVESSGGNIKSTDVCLKGMSDSALLYELSLRAALRSSRKPTPVADRVVAVDFAQLPDTVEHDDWQFDSSAKLKLVAFDYAETLQIPLRRALGQWLTEDASLLDTFLDTSPSYRAMEELEPKPEVTPPSEPSSQGIVFDYREPKKDTSK
jgi:hypothetical protein